MREALERAIDELEQLRSGIRDLPTTPTVTPAELRERLVDRFDFAEPIALTDTVAEVASLLRDGIVHVTHPRYFGLFNPPVHPAGIVADLLVAGFNPQLAAYSHAPAAIEIEQHVLRLFADKIGFDPGTAGACFTSGGAEANHSAVALALAARFPDFVAHGVRTLGGQPVLYVAGEAHDSFRKAAQLCGVGRDAVRRIPVDDTLRMDVGALREAIRRDQAFGAIPFMVIGTAGTTAAGIIDPLRELASVASSEELWFHVDAAWGGGALLSPRLRPLLDGIAGADSVTWDAHKWLSVPMGAGMLFARERAAFSRAFSLGGTGYMPAAVAGGDDPYATSMQWSRRLIGLKAFMTAATLGESGMAAMVEGMVAAGDRLRAKLEVAGWRVVNRTPLPVVCFTRDELGEDAAATGVLADRVQRAGRAWVSLARIGAGRPVLRACITSFETDDDDLDALVDALAAALR